MKLHRIHKSIEKLFKINYNQRSSKGWMMSSESCPFCGKADEHFGIRFNTPNGVYNNYISFHCVRCSERGGEFKLLREIDQLYILEHGDFIDHKKKLQKRIVKGVAELKSIKIDSPVMEIPKGFKRIYRDEYLEGRGFEEWQFETYHIGKTSDDFRLDGYLIFLIMENGQCKGNVARSTKSKEEISAYNNKIKEYNLTRPEGSKKKSKWLRYRNDKAEFDKLLMGIDEVSAETKVVILVEGITDKANVDRLLRLNTSPKTKCLCTFGKSISDEQIAKIKSWGPDITNVILIYDPDAMEDAKGEGDRLGQVFKNTLIGFTRDNDPGDMDIEELCYIIDTAEPPLNFRVNKIQKKSLR